MLVSNTFNSGCIGYCFQVKHTNNKVIALRSLQLTDWLHQIDRTLCYVADEDWNPVLVNGKVQVKLFHPFDLIISGYFTH